MVILAAAIVTAFALSAVGYSLLQPKVYGAQADVLLTPRAELSDAAVDRAMVTQTMLVQSDPVLSPVASQAGMPLNQLRAELSAEVVGRSNILRLTVGDRDRNRATALTQLIATRYLTVATGSAGAAAPGTGTDGGPLAPPAPAAGSPGAGGTAANPGTTGGPAGAVTGNDVAPITPTLLSPAAPLDQPLQPKPLRALAVGVILGLIVAAAAVTVLLRPRMFTRPPPHWA
jgi:uncharacterized protein involved in exopolysaccharide biosynthesis